MDKGLATPKFLYRKHMGCWLHPRTLGMHLRQLRIDVYMYKYICIQSTKHTSICIDLVFVVALGGSFECLDSYQFGLDLAFGVPFRGPLGMALWGVILVRRDPPLGPFARNTVMGGTPWEGKKTAKKSIFIGNTQTGALPPQLDLRSGGGSFLFA